MTYEIKIDVQTEIESDVIKQTTRLNDLVMRRGVSLQEEGVRAALIKLGWTPPEKDKSNYPETRLTMQGSEFANRWICLECRSSIKDYHANDCSQRKKLR